MALTCPVMSIMKSENNDEASSLKMYLTAIRRRINANKTSDHSGQNRITTFAWNRSKIIAVSVCKRNLSGLLVRAKLHYLFS